MGIGSWRIFQIGIFKQLAFLFNAPEQSIDMLMIRPEGSLGIEKLSINTDYVSSPKSKKAWHALHKARVSMTNREFGVLPVSDNSRIPLDPYQHLSADDKAQLASIEDIAHIKYDEAESRLRDKQAENPNAKMARTVLYMVVIIALTVFILPYVFRGCGG